MSYNRLRLGRYSEPGREYFITFVTFNRTPAFDDLMKARVVAPELSTIIQRGVPSLFGNRGFMIEHCAAKRIVLP